MKNFLRLLTISIFAAALTLTAAAHDKHKNDKKNDKQEKVAKSSGKVEFLGKGDGVESCPVTGEALTSKTIKAEFFGRTVYFCCEGCLATAKKNPELYVKKTQKEQLAAIKAAPKAAEHDHAAMAKTDGAAFLGKGDGVESCPVTGEAITSKTIKAEFFGRTVYFCCEGCLATAKKNPELYLKKTEKEQLAAIKAAPKAAEHDHSAMAKMDEKPAGTTFLGKGDGIETCPVTGEPVSKDLKVEVMGRTVYVCCAGCLEKVKKNPELYIRK